MRPKQPKFTDHTDPDSYYNLNKYYNQAEKCFDEIQRWAKENHDLYLDMQDWDSLWKILRVSTKGREGGGKNGDE